MLVKNIFFLEILRKITGVLYKQNKLRGPIQGHESDAAVYPMSINAILINIPFISKAFKWLKRYLTAPSSCSENWVRKKRTTVSEQNIVLSIEKYDYWGTYLYSANHDPDRYILYREGTINQFTQRVGLGNSYWNYLVICRYFFQINKNLFSRG